MTTALPVGRYLKDLGGETSRHGGRSLAPRNGVSELESRIGDAHARGLLEGRAAAQAEIEAALAAQAAVFEEKLAAERQRWAAEQGAVLGERLRAGMGDISQSIAEQVGRILKPVLARQARTKAVTMLAENLREMLARGDYAKIVISGPRDLLAALAARVGNGFAGLSFAEAEGGDLKVSADETILETRISAWARAIDGDDA
jgi:hypothetical protein